MNWILAYMGLGIGITSAFAAAQGTVVDPGQKYWLIGSWFVGLPLSITLMALASR